MGLYGGPASEPAPGERGLGALMLEVRRAFEADDFVETGTFEGATAAWAAQRFDRVVTIEASLELHRAAAERHRALANVRFVHGDTREELRTVVASLSGAAVFWLDAHYSAGATYGADAECPILEEIAAARSGEHDAFLFIDDARLFLAPPPLPHRRTDWPSLARLVQALVDLELFVYTDTIVAVPQRACELVADFLQQEATSALAAEESSRRSAASSAWGALRHSILRVMR